MRVWWIALACLIAGCDSHRVFEDNYDFDHAFWLANDQPVHEFEIKDTTLSYTLYINLRNEVSYPFSNIYIKYYLSDSTNTVLDQKLVGKNLFDPKTGRPFGSSVLGDIYDHQFTILKNHHFKAPGKYSVRCEQYMRKDTLTGVLSLGLRVEKSQHQPTPITE